MDALLQLGDSHWYGRGVNRSWATAAQLYQAASKFSNAQALFNLGIMHEYGAGLPQVSLSRPLSTLRHWTHCSAACGAQVQKVRG